MRAINPKYQTLYTLQTTQIVSGGAVNINVDTSPIPRDQMVSRVFLRVRTDLTVGSGSAKIDIASEYNRKTFLDALISQLTVDMPNAQGDAGGPQIVQSMGLGDLYDLYRQIGIRPTAPTLFGAEGTFFAPVTPAKRNAVTPAPSTQAHYVYLEMPLVDCRIPGAGSGMYLGGDQLAGMNVQLTFGGFTFNDSALTAITIPSGTGSATVGVTAIDIVAEYMATPDGRGRRASPLHFERVYNGVTSDLTLNPQGGAVLCSRLVLASAPADGLADIVRDNIFSTATNLQESAEAAWNPQLKIDGQVPRDLPFRGLEIFAGVDQLNAGLAGLGVDPNALRFANAGTTGAASICPTGYSDYGITLLWVQPSNNLFQELTFGRVDVSFPNNWTTLGNRTLYQVIAYPLSGPDDARAIPGAAQKAAAKASATNRGGFAARLLSILGLRQ
jgi:hypothetical protein